MTAKVVKGGMLTDTLYYVGKFQMYDVDFYVVASTSIGALEGPFFTQEEAMEVLAEILLVDERNRYLWTEYNGSDTEFEMIEINPDSFKEAVFAVLALTVEQVIARKSERSRQKFLQLEELMEYEKEIDQNKEEPPLWVTEYPYENAHVLLGWRHQKEYAMRNPEPKLEGSLVAIMDRDRIQRNAMSAFPYRPKEVAYDLYCALTETP